MLDVIINYVRSLQNQIEVCLRTQTYLVQKYTENFTDFLYNSYWFDLICYQFLSMKLSAASLFYDFNSPEAEVFETLRVSPLFLLSMCHII